ncbi:TNT domain-containing protein [Microtetraspora niveoalba]|uniref:TNT domain-containing protein n=1 Tax=Microtetraspora niveoalba TaxID=46175 RepID=UPI000A72B595|nr:TNT domain-containing protein [Microtetraspora niveoalba]
MQGLSRRAPLVAALAMAAAALMGVPAQAHATASVTGTRSPALPRPETTPTPEPGVTQAPSTAAQVCGPPYVQGNPNLGPLYLPRNGWLGRILRGYMPLGGLPPMTFIYRYWNESTNGWRYPPDFGFAHSGGYTNGRPLASPEALPVGRKLDRFGGEGGSFLAPYGTPYGRRALPPSNLNTFLGDPEHLCNYHAYEVVKAFTVEAGPAASAFQQQGVGRQYHLLSKYIPEAPQSPAELPVSWLVANGYLKRLN